jgi:hypothetical protein
MFWRQNAKKFIGESHACVRHQVHCCVDVGVSQCLHLKGDNEGGIYLGMRFVMSF